MLKEGCSHYSEHFTINFSFTDTCEHTNDIQLASSPGHSQILSHSHGEKSGESLGSKLRHGLEMVDSVSTNRVHHFRSVM